MDQELVFVCPCEEAEKDKLLHEFEKKLADSTLVRTLGVTMPFAAAYYRHISAMISSSFSLGMTRLELNFSCPSAWNESPCFILPDGFYRHQANLEGLKLYRCTIDVRRLSNLGSLRSLSIGWVEIQMINVKKLLHSCPVLESLRLERCQHNNLDLSAYNSKLKNLVVDKCYYGGDFVRIHCRKLRMLCYSGRVSRFDLKFNEQLEEAEIDFGLQTVFVEGGALLSGLLKQLRACKFLKVCGILLQIVPSQENQRTNLDLNVEHLTIMNTALHKFELCGLMYMLASCPRMKTLTIRMGGARIFGTGITSQRPLWSGERSSLVSVLFQGTPAQTCLTESLLELNIRHFKGTRNEIAVIADIIRHGQCLRSVNIYISEEDKLSDNYNGIIKEADAIRTFPRANPNLEITVSVMQMPMI